MTQTQALTQALVLAITAPDDQTIESGLNAVIEFLQSLEGQL